MKQKLFFRDFKSNQNISYLQLYNDILNTNRYNIYCKSDDYYTVFKNVVLSIVLGKEIVLLDADFSDDEVLRLTEISNLLNYEEEIENVKSIVGDFDNFIFLLRKPADYWKITLFTSGTTGLPKKVTHSFDTISRSVKIGERFTNNIWGFAYNPTHMAGVQVFFQALLNLNTVVKLFGLDKMEIFDEINSTKISHISATPTFYRLLLPSTSICKSVEGVTSGGEKFDKNASNQLRILFPNAKFTNVYASTEAGSLFASAGDEFCISPGFLDNIIIKNNELFIHKSLMGQSAIKYNADEWYATGDLVEVLSENPLRFRFISRKNEMINVGGYKVNPHEVEDYIRNIDGVIDVYVYAKPNSILGNIIIAKVIANDLDLSEQSIRKYLQTKLQEFKIPRIIKFVDKINITRTGKVSRI